MSYTKTLFISTSLLLCSLGVSANGPDFEAGESQSLPVTLQTLLESNGRDNLIELFQIGVQNQVIATQAGEHNQLMLTQLGVGNEATVTQLGFNNEVELLQAGNHNSAEVTQIGDNNLVQLSQLGSANFSIQQIGDGASIAVTQY